MNVMVRRSVPSSLHGSHLSRSGSWQEQKGQRGSTCFLLLFAAFCCITNRRTSYLHLLGNSVALIGSFHSHTHTHADFVRSFPGEVKSADRLTRSTDCSAACGNRTKATAPTCFRVYTGSCCTLNVLNQSSVRTTK